MKQHKNLNDSDILNLIRKSGFRATPQRKALISFLQKSRYPMSIQDIIAKMANRNDVNQVTIYRMVEAFKKAEILREVNFNGDRPRYELSDIKNDHHHIVCIKCHKLEDFIACNYEEIKTKALRQSHFFKKITNHSFDLYGVCIACAK